jgi:hypothetical protein
VKRETGEPTSVVSGHCCPPHQEDNESSTNEKRRRAIDMNEDHVPESSNAGPDEINFCPGSVNSPFTVDSTAHSKWKSPLLPEKTRAKRLACPPCMRLTTVKYIQCDHSFCDDGSGAGSALCFCWTKHKDQKVLWIIICNLPICIAEHSE